MHDFVNKRSWNYVKEERKKRHG